MKRIGIIGCGKIAQVRHIPELAAHPEVEIAGYYNPTRARAEQMARTYGGRVYDSIEDMLADASVEALSSRDGGDLAAEKVLPAMKAVFAAIRSDAEGRFVII